MAIVPIDGPSTESVVEIRTWGPYGSTSLVSHTDGTYTLEGDPPDRHALIMVAIGIIEELTEEEREEFGLEGVYL